VREQCRPVARSIRFAGTPGAKPSAGLAEALARPDLAAIILCPSNPFLSVDPILAVDGVRERLSSLAVPLVAVSPLVGGKAVKGPLAKLLSELGRDCDNRSIAAHYGSLLDHLVIDETDEADADGLRKAGLCVTVTQTIMQDANDRERLAREVLAAAGLDDE
jgi:LPPG:FO 2-phospho-L-lactate transferase